jgi:uncharacterized protein
MAPADVRAMHMPFLIAESHNPILSGVWASPFYRTAPPVDDPAQVGCLAAFRPVGQDGRGSRRLEGKLAMPETPFPRFACDAMLGGLARWLRAAGYDASRHEGIDDGDLIRLARTEGRTVLSSDDDVFAFAVVRDGMAPALFVPRGLTIQEQTAHVLRRLGLALREPRRMACGGELVELSKQEAAGRAPPRSLAFYERFWVCAGCGKVFWRGTHWERIAKRLQDAAP